MNRGILRGLWNKPEYVPNRITIICGNPTFSGENFASLGYPVLDHLAADGAGLAGGQVAVVAVGQVDTDFRSGLHLELVHGFLSLRNVQLIIVVAHRNSLLFIISGKQDTFRIGEHLFFRGHSVTKAERAMSGEWRKDWGN